MQGESTGKNTGELIVAFWEAPLAALFAQPTIAAVLDLSEQWCERARWDGNGPPYLKIARAVRYRKADVVEWLAKRQVSSTSEPTRASTTRLTKTNEGAEA